MENGVIKKMSGGKFGHCLSILQKFPVGVHTPFCAFRGFACWPATVVHTTGRQDSIYEAPKSKQELLLRFSRAVQRTFKRWYARSGNAFRKFLFPSTPMSW